MDQVTTIGLDIAKSTFQVHGVDGGGEAFFDAVSHPAGTWLQ